MTANHLELTLAGSYVLGTLDAAEHDAFVAHLRTCAECQQEVRSLQPVAEALAASVPTRTPRPELRQRVLTQVSPADASRAAVTPRSRWWAEPRTWLPVAALLIASLGLGVYAQRLHSRIDSLEARLDAALRDAESSRTALAEARGVAGRAQNAMAVLASPDMARIESGRPGRCTVREGARVLEPESRPRLHGHEPAATSARSCVSDMGPHQGRSDQCGPRES